MFTMLFSNDFPTKDRVEFVYECMALKGKMDYVNSSACSCTLDNIAKVMSYKEFVEYDSINRLENMRGERGSVFRSSSKMARDKRKTFRKIKKVAMKTCFSTVIANN